MKCRTGARNNQSVDDLLLLDYVSHPLYVNEWSRNNVVAPFLRWHKLEEGETSWTMQLSQA